MRFRVSLVLSVLICTSSLFASDRWVLISGTVSNFHTDARVFNPSFDKDIVVSATLLPQGNGDNSARTPVTFTVPKRQMRIMNDVTTELFNTNLLGAIRFSSNDEFEVTSRIYAISTTCPAGTTGTLGQFGPGLPIESAKAKGALLQLRAFGARGTAGTFRTNIGAVNPSTSTVKVTWTLYDKANATVSSGTTDMPPLGVIGPTSMSGTFFFNPGSADLSDAWVSYKTEPSTPIFVYASVLDNGSEDQTFVPAVEDKGIPPVTPPPVTTKSFDVSLQNFSIRFSPAVSGLQVGDVVALHIHNAGDHGFTIVTPNGEEPVSFNQLPNGANRDVTFTITAIGTYGYFCSNEGCGSGHSAMSGTFNVGASGPDPGRGY